MKVLVLGASGFLGSNLISELLSRRCEIIGFGLPDKRNDVLRGRGVEMIEGDFTNPGLMEVPMEGIDWLVHFASTTSPRESVADPERDAVNLTASKVMFEEAVKNRVKKILFASSGGTVYGTSPRVPARETDPVHPIIPYTRTKLAIESELLRACGGSQTAPIILRYGNPYGPNQYPEKGTGVVTAWLEAVRDGRKIVLFGDGESARDFIYIKDLVSATVASLENPGISGVYNIGSGNPTTLNELLKVIKKVTKIEPEVERVQERPSDMVRVIALDSSKASLEFGWRPTVTLEEGIALTWRWVKAGEPFVVG
jgi:UDP-glucose 4-epimerase